MSATPRRPAADEIAALLEPIARRNIPGAADARIANWRSAERGLSTETFLFDLQQGRDEGPTTLKQLVFRLGQPGKPIFPYSGRPPNPFNSFCEHTSSR